MTEPVLRARNAPAPAQAPAAAAVPARTAPGTDAVAAWERAAQIARAREILPRAYQQNAGTVWLVLGWAESNGVDPLTAIYGVNFVQNRPVIDARLQAALAERDGYRVAVEHADDKSATVAVSRGGEILGRTTYTIEDAARAGLAGRDNWRKHPRRMLVARARTEAISFHAPSVGVALAIADEPAEIAVGGEETVETSPAPTPSAEPTPTAPPETPPRVGPDTVDALDEILDAEIVDTNPRPDVETEPSTDTRADVEGSPAPDRTSIAATRGRARAAVERVKALGQYAELVDAMREREIPTAQSRWTGEQCAVVLGLAEKLAAQADTTGGDQ